MTSLLILRSTSLYSFEQVWLFFPTFLATKLGVCCLLGTECAITCAMATNYVWHVAMSIRAFWECTFMRTLSGNTRFGSQFTNIGILAYSTLSRGCITWLVLKFFFLNFNFTQLPHHPPTTMSNIQSNVEGIANLINSNYCPQPVAIKSAPNYLKTPLPCQAYTKLSLPTINQYWWSSPRSEKGSNHPHP